MQVTNEGEVYTHLRRLSPGDVIRDNVAGVAIILTDPQGWSEIEDWPTLNADYVLVACLLSGAVFTMHRNDSVTHLPRAKVIL